MGEGPVSAAHRHAGGPLLERDREVAALDDLITAAAGGEGWFAVFEAVAGMGKTRLVAETRLRAEEAGLRVLRARGGELEREFAFGVVRQLFEPALERRDAFDGASAAARAVFEDEAGAADGASFAVLHGLYWLVVDLSAERPLLLAVDDLHWCDHASLRFLAYLVRRLDGVPALVVGALRPSEAGVDEALIREIERDPRSVVLRPGPLSPQAVEELVHGRLGANVDAAFAAACGELTGGNPLLLDEILKAVEANDVPLDASGVRTINELGPRAVSRAVLLRLSRTSEDAVAVARALAILGDGADLSTIAALAALDEERAAHAVDELIHAGTLRPELPLGFVHPLVAAAVDIDVPAGQRVLRHQQAAALLTASRVPAERIAAHLLLVPPRGADGAVSTLQEAARAARAKGAAESAVSYLERALAEPPTDARRREVVLELGRAEALTNGAAASEHLREAYDLLDDPHERAATARGLTLTLLYTGRTEEAAQVAKRAASELPHTDDARKQLEAFEYATTLFGVGEITRLRELGPDEAPQGLGEKALAALAAYDRALTGERADACARVALGALAGGELTRAYNGFLNIPPIAVLAAADRGEALGAFDEALAAAHAGGSVFSVSSIRTWRAWALFRRGDLVESEQEFDAALEGGRTWGFGLLNRIYRGALKPSLHIERGELARARDVLTGFGDPGLAAARFIAGDPDDPDASADVVRYWLLARLELLVAEGRFEDAVSAADGIAVRFAHVVNPAFGPWRTLKARALDRLGRHDEAIALAAEEVELARTWGAPWALGRALRELGTLERSAGLDALDEAIGVLDGTPARLELAKSLAALGSTLRLARRPSDAREPLRRALELAQVCGATALADHARSELYATGARPRKVALSGVDSLTTSERRVATLAAEGQSNRDIAQALFVTPKTIEVHLSNTYRKLGIRSRRELTAALSAG
jgi:DNA-binding CsgD family transcriptional regulator